MTKHTVPSASMATCLLTVALGACTGVVPAPTTADARRVGAPLGELTEGRRIYVRKCSGCHALVPPAERSAAVWREKLGVMATRARLDPLSRRRITAYLTAFSHPERPAPSSSPAVRRLPTR